MPPTMRVDLLHPGFGKNLCKSCIDKLATNICETDYWQFFEINSWFQFQAHLFFSSPASACLANFYDRIHILRTHIWSSCILYTCAWAAAWHKAVQHLDFRVNHCWFWVLCRCETKDRRGHAYVLQYCRHCDMISCTFICYFLYIYI